MPSVRFFLALLATLMLFGTAQGQLPPGRTEGQATSSQAISIEVGPIWNEADANSKCMRACSASGRVWNGKWRAAQDNRSASCDCVPFGTPGGGTATPPAPPVSDIAYPGRVIRYDHTDFVANDLERSTAASYDLCAQACIDDKRCVAFTYTVAGSCTKKSAVGTLQPTSSASSGFVAGRATLPPPPTATLKPDPGATSNGCSIKGAGKCPGCSISCPFGERPVCTPPDEGVGGFCLRDAVCGCVRG